MKHLVLLVSFILFSVLLKAQDPLTTNCYNYNIIDRYEILSGVIDSNVFTSVKPYKRLNTYLSVTDYNGNKALELNRRDNFNLEFSRIDNSEYLLPTMHTPLGAIYHNPAERKAILNTFYAYKNAFYHVDYVNDRKKERFKLILNPIIGLSAAQDRSDTLSQYRNTRGIVMRGSIGGKVGFFSRVTENQFRFPSHIRTEINETEAVTGATLHKNFGEGGQDFFKASGYITFSPINEIMVQFGHDNLFIGNGYRSLILSDRTAPFPFLRLNTRVWKFNYQNIFMEHIDYRGESVGRPLQKKFSALHHLSINITKNLNIGFFENIIFDRQDSLENNRYDLQYLNPIIFYRAVEHGLNSTDNAMLGMDWKWNFMKQFSFYGQWVFDEFVKNEFVSMSDNWVNKWAYQAGLKYINVANVNNLDLQLEVNQVRPYVYSHRYKAQNWTHYNQELAHPLGANFREFIAIVRYQPAPRWNVCLFNTVYRQGVDSSYLTNVNGANILNSNSDIRDKDNAPMFQGLQSRVHLSSLTATYMFFHNFFLDATVQYRNSRHDLYGNADQLSFGLGIRLNTNLMLNDY